MIAQSPAEMPTFDEMTSMSGLDFMLAMQNGTVTAPPIAGLMNYDIDTVEHGRVGFRGTPSFAHCNPMSGIHGGWYGTLLDTCMACAVLTALPKGSYYTTLEYKVNLIRALKIGTEIIATGFLDHAGRSTGVAHGEIRGAADGRLYATGNTTCLVMQRPQPET